MTVILAEWAHAALSVASSRDLKLGRELTGSARDHVVEVIPAWLATERVHV